MAAWRVRGCALALTALWLSALPGSLLAQSASPTTPVRDVLCHDQHDGNNRESICLKQLGAIASRRGNDLRLKLANAATRAFTTTQKACDDGDHAKCKDFRLSAYYPRHHLFLVARNSTEGGDFLLISARTGKELQLDEIPHFSPSGKRMAAVSASESYNDNSIEIWTTGDNLPKREWRHEVPNDKYELYEFESWDGDDRLKMRVTLRIGEELRGGIPVEAVRTASGWQLMPPTLDAGGAR